MFGRSRPVLFEPYGRRSRARVPRWLVLFLLGTLVGAAGLAFVQWRYLPPRLSAEASSQLRHDVEQARSRGRQLDGELATATRERDAAVAERGRLSGELAASRDAVARLSDELSTVVDVLPPDPRGGSVQVRAARFFNAAGGKLGYELVLSRERAASRALDGVLEFVVEGAPARAGASSSFTSKPVAASIGARAVVRGSIELPEGFRPRQSTVRVLERAGGKVLGSRVLLVQ